MLSQRLRHRIEFQERVEIVSSYGESLGWRWQTADIAGFMLDDVPAEVLSGPGREFIASDAKQAQTSARINLRWFAGLDQTWRILWEAKVYDIVEVGFDATARKEYRLRCEEGVNDGS